MSRLLEIAIKNSINANQDSGPFDPGSAFKRNNMGMIGTSNVEDVPIQPKESSWERIDDYNASYLSKIFNFKTEKHLVYFLNEVILHSGKLNHSPKIIIEDLKVIIETYTHDLNDITELDLELTGFIDEVYGDIVYINRV